MYLSVDKSTVSGLNKKTEEHMSVTRMRFGCDIIYHRLLTVLLPSSITNFAVIYALDMFYCYMEINIDALVLLYVGL